jgi:hypothetical protein
MAEWNQKQWGDPRFETPTIDILNTGYIYGDYDATTLPGIIGGVKTDAITTETILTAEDQVGISKFTDLTENFSQTYHISSIDNNPIGSLIWDDAQLAAYDSKASFESVMVRYFPIPHSGCVDVKPINISGIHDRYELLQNYPNPFNPTTTIQFSLPESQNVILKIYNILGQEVATLLNENMRAGVYTADFDATRLSTGLYIYRLRAGSFTGSKKMLLLK